MAIDRRKTLEIDITVRRLEPRNLAADREEDQEYYVKEEVTKTRLYLIEAIKYLVGEILQ